VIKGVFIGLGILEIATMPCPQNPRFPYKKPQVCYNKAILKKYLSPKRRKHTHGVKTMIKQKRSKVKQSILPFIL